MEDKKTQGKFDVEKLNCTIEYIEDEIMAGFGDSETIKALASLIQARAIIESVTNRI